MKFKPNMVIWLFEIYFELKIFEIINSVNCTFIFNKILDKIGLLLDLNQFISSAYHLLKI